MFAARVLRDHFERVTVIDRDDLPQSPGHRAGVPQSHHAHGLLARGQQIIEGHFPGIMAELQSEGALETRLERLVIVTPAGKITPARDAESGTFVSRYLLEWKVRQRLLSDPRIQFVFNSEVVQLIGDARQVTGVSLRARRPQKSEESLTGDLVVDASGRRSEAPRWLAALGCDIPPEETINSGVGYLSRFYRKPDGFPADWDGIIINARPPHNPRAGLILPIEGDRWHVTLGNYAGHYPQTETATTETGFLDFARSLADPSIYEALRAAEPLTPVKVFRTPTNRLRHFERMRRPPVGFIAIGDSVCAFNPIYGQGMTTSALGSLVLAQAVTNRSPGFEQRFQRALAKAVSAPWFIATSEDLRWSGVRLEGAPPRIITPLLRRYVSLLLEAARVDPLVSGAYMRMLNMLDLPSALLRPSVAGRVLAHSLRRMLGMVTVKEEWALSPAMIAVLRSQTPRQSQEG
jgi:2-polyprenyl-6-methoxyphenol hydroxylase-like FAD-dependent oxidoreductase